MTAATPGRRLGRYHLVEPLGGGPCGEVYRAKVVGVAGMERQLAVKRFHPQVLATPGVSGRLSQAARTYGGLDHPRLARLAELGVAAGETFTAVEWVNGLDLSRLLTMAIETASPLPPGATLGLVSAAARAIGYAHGRGVTHLGLSPTNLIATADGDVKVTDVGILACRLPPRPSQDPSLTQRIAYLAPEQLIGEPVSAATDVFVLGVIAYELCAGVRPFMGMTPMELEQAVLSARPGTLELPRPIVRVIDRCLARSPFERFPDARALADALDAALRLSPLAGGKRDISDRVTAALEHIARMNEQQLSGALSFAVPNAPQPAPRGPANLPLKPPSPTGRATVFGVPAPAPIPQRLRPPSVAPPVSQSGARLRPGSVAPPPRAPTERTDDPTISRDESSEENLSVGDDTVPRIEPMWPPTEQVQTLKAPPGGLPSAGGLMTKTIAVPPPPPATRPIGSNPPPFDPSHAAPPVMPEGSPQPMSSGGGPPQRTLLGGPPPAPPRPPGPPGPPGPPSYGGPQAPPPPPMPAPPPVAAPYPPPFAMSGTPSVRPRWQSIAMIAAIVVILGGVAAGAGFLIHRSLTETSSSGTTVASGAVIDAASETATAATDAASGKAKPEDAARAVAAPIDAAEAVAEIDAGAALIDEAVDAAAAAPAIDAGGEAAPPDPSDKLVIRSTPAGARVYIDGADEGKTPLTLNASSDRHTLAIVLAGHDLYLAEVDGRGTHDAKLTPVTPPEGPGGIKVRCKADDRYYVFLDGKPTGQLCPTERLGVEKGEHTVEVYDLVSETRKTFNARVKETRVSVRVRVDYD